MKKKEGNMKGIRRTPESSGVLLSTGGPCPFASGLSVGGQLHSAEYHVIAVVAVVERAVYTADGGSGSARFFGNFEIGLTALEHGGHLKALRQGEQFVYGAQILKKTVALLPAFQAEDGVKQGIHGFCLNFFVHFSDTFLVAFTL